MPIYNFDLKLETWLYDKHYAWIKSEAGRWKLIRLPDEVN